MNALPTGRILSLQVSRPQNLVSDEGKRWRSAIAKVPVPGPVRLDGENFEGDYQANRKYHGGPDKAVCFFSAEHFAELGAAFDLSLTAGAFGENLTVEGLTEDLICIGDTIAAGTIRLQVSQPRQPCASIIKRWGARELPKRMEETGWTGFYCRVLQFGAVSGGESIEVVERPNPGWTIARANSIVYAHRRDAADMAALRAIPLLSHEWQGMLDNRLERLRGE